MDARITELQHGVLVERAEVNADFDRIGSTAGCAEGFVERGQLVDHRIRVAILEQREPAVALAHDALDSLGQVDCDVWAEKDDGTRACLGSASALRD